MTKVFLSYDHGDSDRARPIARALEKAGHRVWWDQHIRSGAEYSEEIGRALDEAEAVVVLWSARSIKSAWVRDEAAAGRDNGRLVPVTIDGTEPPLGFRQFQLVDLSSWSGRGSPPQLRTLLADIGHRAEARAQQPKGFADYPAPRQAASLGRARAAVAVIAATIVIAIAVSALVRPWEKARPVSVKIEAANLSPTSQAYAQDLLAQLGQLQAANPDALALVDPNNSARTGLIFKLAGAAESRTLRANLVLLDGKDSSLLWSQSFERPVGKEGDLHQQIGFIAAQVLECAAEARPDGKARISSESFKLYLNGCAAFADKTPENIPALVQTFTRLTAQEPKFSDGWSKLLLTESNYTHMTYLPESAGVLAQLPGHITEARRVDPAMPAAFLADAALRPSKAFEQRIDLLQKGLAKDPNDAAVLSFLSDQLRTVGRIHESVDVAERAVRANPLSPAIRQGLVSALTYAGQTDAALAEVGKMAQIWPGASNVRFARFGVDLRYGDPRKAMEQVRSGEVSMANTPYVESFIAARITPSPANIERTIADARRWYQQEPSTIYHLIQVLGTFDRTDDVFAILLDWSDADVTYVLDGLFRPALRNVHRDPRMMPAAKRLGLLSYWQKTGNWPDFCLEPDLPYDCKKEAAKLKA